jgi:phosphoglycerate kinase
VLERAGSKLVLPVDCVVAGEPEPEARTFLMNRTDVPPEGAIYDIGPKSVATFREFVERARTIVWNGPMGLFEVAPFAEGTRGVAHAIADATDRGATSIVGGGDTVAAVEEADVAGRITHISTGGGASLEFLEGRTLPGVAVLDGALHE